MTLQAGQKPSSGKDKSLYGISKKDTKATRLFVIGDSHGHAGVLENACRNAGELGADQVWSVGDFGIWPGRHGRAFLDSVQHDAEKHGVDIYVVPGNHDDYDQIDNLFAAADADAAQQNTNPPGAASIRKNIQVLRRGHVMKIHDTRVMCLSGAASIDGPGGVWLQARGPGDGWWEQERISDQDVERAIQNIDASGGKVELMICHDLPSAQGVIGQKDFPLGEQIRERIGRVAAHGEADILLAGHWHRHIDRTVGHRREIVLSADIAPHETQWAIVDISPGRPLPRVQLPTPWSYKAALS